MQNRILEKPGPIIGKNKLNIGPTGLEIIAKNGGHNCSIIYVVLCYCRFSCKIRFVGCRSRENHDRIQNVATKAALHIKRGYNSLGKKTQSDHTRKLRPKLEIAFKVHLKFFFDALMNYNTVYTRKDVIYIEHNYSATSSNSSLLMLELGTC